MSQLKQKLEDLKESIHVGDSSLEAVRDMLGSAAFSVNGALPITRRVLNVRGIQT